MITLDGYNEIQASLEALADMQGLRAALGKCCALVERSAKQKCPKDTGALRNSISSEVRGHYGIIFTNQDYAPYVEYGTGLFAEGGNGRTDVPWVYQADNGEWYSTSGHPPQPFMRPALDENKEMIYKILKGALITGP